MSLLFCGCSLLELHTDQSLKYFSQGRPSSLVFPSDSAPWFTSYQTIYCLPAVILLSWSSLYGGASPTLLYMGYRSTCPFCSHSMVCIRYNSYFVGIRYLRTQEFIGICCRQKNSNCARTKAENYKISFLFP